MGFTYPKDLARHKRSKHCSTQDGQSSLSDDGRTYCSDKDCAYSTKGFARRDKYLLHKRRKHP